MQFFFLPLYFKYLKILNIFLIHWWFYWTCRVIKYIYPSRHYFWWLLTSAWL